MNIWKLLFRAKVWRLRLRPGDVVVLECRKPLTLEQVDRLSAAWEEMRRRPGFPDVNAVVFDSSVTARRRRREDGVSA